MLVADILIAPDALEIGVRLTDVTDSTPITYRVKEQRIQILRAGPVGSVWGLAPGRVGALGFPPDALLAQPRGTERSRGVRWRPRED